MLLTKLSPTMSCHLMLSTLQRTGLLLKRTAPWRISVQGKNLGDHRARSVNSHKAHMHFFTSGVLLKQDPHRAWARAGVGEAAE